MKKDDKEKVKQITMRNVSLKLHKRIEQEAEFHKRSANNELLIILERYFFELDKNNVALYERGLEK